MTYPLPKKMIADFRARVEKLYIVEELDPFLEEAIRLMGIKIDGGKELNSLLGEISPSSVALSLAKAGVPGVNPELLVDVRPAVEGLPSRPPTLCPGCSHRGIFTVLKKLRVFVSGDIGCYTLGALEPFNSVHASTCMGASISMAHGMAKVQEPGPAPAAEARPDFRNKVVGIIGDSTFYHSGITSLMDVAYNNGNTLNIIVDNSTTAMTGGQENPGTGKTLLGDPSQSVDLPALVRALGIKRVATIDDPYRPRAGRAGAARRTGCRRSLGRHRQVPLRPPVQDQAAHLPGGRRALHRLQALPAGRLHGAQPDRGR